MTAACPRCFEDLPISPIEPCACGGCRNCGRRERRRRWGRCDACYRFLKRRGIDRPLELVERRIQRGIEWELEARLRQEGQRSNRRGRAQC